MQRTARITRAAVVGLAGVIVIAVAGLVIWAKTGLLPAERSPLATARANPAISITDNDGTVVMTPTDTASGSGLVFIPGAKVDPYAYVSKLSGIVEQEHHTVVITKPILNLAFFDRRQLTVFTADAPNVQWWYVGGHSLGGVRACQYAEDEQVHGLVLLGSYCANDLSESDLRVLSISGSEDGLSTPEKIRAAAHLLPATTTFVRITGANHARFGDYGRQDGDGTATVGSPQVRATITDQLARLLQTR